MTNGLAQALDCGDEGANQYQQLDRPDLHRKETLDTRELTGRERT